MTEPLRQVLSLWEHSSSTNRVKFALRQGLCERVPRCARLIAKGAVDFAACFENPYLSLEHLVGDRLSAILAWALGIVGELGLVLCEKRDHFFGYALVDCGLGELFRLFMLEVEGRFVL